VALLGIVIAKAHKNTEYQTDIIPGDLGNLSEVGGDWKSGVVSNAKGGHTDIFRGVINGYQVGCSETLSPIELERELERLKLRDEWPGNMDVVVNGQIIPLPTMDPRYFLPLWMTELDGACLPIVDEVE